MSNYRLDRTQFEAFKAEEKQSDYGYWSERSMEERLEGAYYLICSSYGINPNNFPKIDKTHFEVYKQQ